MLRRRGIVVIALMAACASPPPPEPPRPEPAPPVAEKPAPAPAPAPLVGMYAYMADAATFTDCATGTRYPVAFEGDHVSVERAYLATPHEPGAPVLVTLQGYYDTRPPMEGAPRAHLVVHAFDAIWPEETCSKATVDTPLRNTYWKLVELKGLPVRTHEDQREVHLLLRDDEPTARGFAGCNRFTGGFIVDGDTLRFAKMERTLLACTYLEEEQEFLDTLESVMVYRILGETLVLSSDAGRVARFRAVYF